MRDGNLSNPIADDGVQHRVGETGHTHLAHAAPQYDARLRVLANLCDCALNGIDERSAKDVRSIA